MSATGAADGDTATVGVPNAIASIAGLLFTAYVHAANSVKVRACNVATSASADPLSGTIRVDIWKH